MKKLAVLAVAVALAGFAPRDAVAQGSQSMSIGAVFPTLLGACTGGWLGYYFVTGPVATLVGAAAGGALGNWWYSAGTARDAAVQSGKTKMFSTETPPVQLIGYDSALRQNLRTATFSAASD